MSSAPLSRWTDGSMHSRVRKRYAAERRFRLAGLFAVGLSVAFLAFLLVTMAWKGLGGFTRYEAALPIDFPRSDLLIDPAALRGPQAATVAAGADLEGTIAQAAAETYGPQAAEMFGGGAVRSLADELVSDTSLL